VIMSLRKATLYARTLRHLKPGQVAWRGRYVLRRYFGLHPRIPVGRVVPVFDPDRLDALRRFLALSARHHRPAGDMIAALREGRFSFLNHTEQAASPPWEARGLPRLWRYQLHGFGYLRHLAAENLLTEHGGDGEIAAAWMHDWIARNPPGTDVAWDAYPTAARLIHWALAESVFRGSDAVIRRSFQQQTGYLQRSIEYDIRANHLLQNAVGLLIAGTVLGGPPAPLARRLLEQQVEEQILPDGGHYERSPMYHAQVLELCLLAYAALEDPPRALSNAIARMTAFLERLRHLDGAVPLFGDSTLEGAPPAEALIATARECCGLPENETPTGSYTLPESGFYVLGPADNSARMIVKAGSPGPRHQLGHAHCDMGSYELCIGPQRVVVDSGVHGYEGSPYRAYCRSTRAHNTVQINGLEQMECWAAFRVGRRYGGRVLAHFQKQGGQSLFLEHNGFRPFLHRRTIDFFSGKAWMVWDSARGPGPLAVQSFVHLHPGLQWVEAGAGWQAWGHRLYLTLFPFFEGEVAVVQGEEAPQQGWYCPRFGQAIPAATLVLRAEGTAPLHLGYAIVPADAAIPSLDTLHLA